MASVDDDNSNDIDILLDLINDEDELSETLYSGYENTPTGTNISTVDNSYKAKSGQSLEIAADPINKESSSGQKQKVFTECTGNKSRGGHSREVDTDPADNEIVDPLELELRAMESRMKKLKEELAKKKQITNPNQKFTKYCPIIQKPTEHVRELANREKEELLNSMKRKHSEIHQGDTDSEDDDDHRSPMEQKLSTFGRDLKKRIAHSEHTGNSVEANRNPTTSTSQSLSTSQSKPNWKSVNGSLISVGKLPSNLSESQKDVSCDPFSGIKILKPLVTASTMSSLMDSRRMIPMSAIAANIRGGEIDGDWVTIGVVISKSPTKTSQKGSQYCILQMSDLKDCTKLVSLFLFAAAYKNLWKTAIGSVFGILNPQIMKDRQDDKAGSVTLSINNNNNVLHMGSSKDLGWCKGKIKEGGSQCRHFVNIAVCEFCVYHIQTEYTKMCSRRSDVQSSFSRVDPKNALKNKVLGKNMIFYGGQSYTASTSKPKESTRFSGTQPVQANRKKDLSTLSSLKLQNTVNQLKDNAKNETEKRLIESEGTLKTTSLKHMTSKQIEAAKQIARESEELGNMMLAPSPGARNFLLHRSKEEETKAKEDGTTSVHGAKQLLLIERKKDLEKQKQLEKVSKSPQLGRGLRPSQSLEFDVGGSPKMSNKKKSLSPAERKAKVAKVRAAFLIQQRGGNLKSLEKNMIRNREKASSEGYQAAIRKKVELETVPSSDEGSGSLESVDILKSSSKSTGNITEKPNTKKEVEPNRKKSLLGTIDLNSEKMKALFNAKSSHGELVQAAEDVEYENYYKSLEKKEMIENKMLDIKEIDTKAVVCLQCKYTAFKASDMCKAERHTLKVIDAKKRFFECSNCKRRKITLEKMPTRKCENCDVMSWRRVAMGKERKGPQLESEVLSLRGDELGSYAASGSKVYLHV